MSVNLPRFAATPPPGLGSPAPVRRSGAPYAGPPSYGHTHPAWGFPPVAKHTSGGQMLGGQPDRGQMVGGQVVRRQAIRYGMDPWEVGGDGATIGPGRGAFTAATLLAVLTAVACLAAGMAEAWRFALLLRGRTEVLPGDTVRTSDLVVQITGVTTLWLGVVTACAVLWVVIGVHYAALRATGRAPARSSVSLVARCVVPGWNLYGVGQVLMETTRMVKRVHREQEHREQEHRERTGEGSAGGADQAGGGAGHAGSAAPAEVRPGRAALLLVGAWWIAWAINGALVLLVVVLTAVMWRWGADEQLMANMVELHLAVDGVAVLMALCTAGMLASLGRMWAPRVPREHARWAIQQPISTAENRAGPTADTGSAPETPALGALQRHPPASDASADVGRHP